MTKLLVTAEEAAERLGYDTTAQFRRAVQKGIFPKAKDPTCRPPRWSWPAIEACLLPESANRDGVNEIDRALGM